MENLSFVRRISQLGTWLQTCLTGVEVGRDASGNRYYREKNPLKGVREKRWVIYVGEPEASKIPPEWHIWMHHTAPAPLAAGDVFHKPWQKPHQENLTGTAEAYLPAGHILAGGVRPKATGDYEAWKPE